MAALAVGLALRRHRSFSWADCAIPVDETSPGSRSLLQRGWSRPVGDGVTRSDLTVPSWSADLVERVLVPENRMDSLRLMSYLTLPSLLQELSAMSTAPSGESFVILTNIDALDLGLRNSVFGRSDVHLRLRGASVSLFVTAKSRPTQTEAGAFDRILEVEVARGASWPEGTVRLEKGHDPGWDGQPVPFRAAWQNLGLDPTLLPSL